MSISVKCVHTGNDGRTHYVIWPGRDCINSSCIGFCRKSFTCSTGQCSGEIFVQTTVHINWSTYRSDTDRTLATGTAWGEWGVDEMATLVSGGTQLGYTPSGMESGFELSTLFPDYSMTGMPEWTGYILSAVVGVALLVIFFKIISSLMKDKVDFKKKAA